MPTRDSIHLARFKARARALHKAVLAADATALARIRPFFKPQEFKLAQAQLVIARELGFSSWKALATTEQWFKCSFCRKWQYELNTLIEGPGAVHICGECIDLCNSIIEQRKGV